MTDVLAELGRQLNRHDVDAVLSLLAPEACIEVRQLDAVWKGPEEVGGALRALFAAVPDFKWSASHRYVGTAELTEEGVWTGRHAGPLAGHPGTDNTLAVRARAVVDQLDGLPTACRISLDVAGMRLAMGLPVTAVEAANTSASISQIEASDAVRVSEVADPAVAARDDGRRAAGRRAGPLVGAVALAVAALIGVVVWGHLQGQTAPHRQATLPTVPAAGPTVPASAPAVAGPRATSVATPIAGVTTKGRQVTLSADVLFDVGQAQLTPRAQAVLARVAALLASRQPHGLVVVSGYTDSTGSADSNQRLSLARAQAVVAALQQQAAASHLLFQARGLGSSQPVASNATADGRSLNRRVTIVLPTS